MEYLKTLKSLESKQESMVALLKELVNINSHSENLEGIKRVQQKIQEFAKILKCSATFIKTPKVKTVDPSGHPLTKKYGDILKLKKRPKAPVQILLMGHADTVYPIESPFQNFSRKKNTLFGPGVADMKGGLVIMLHVLEAIERSSLKETIGWTALINADEEIGSIASVQTIEKETLEKDFALVFEPAKDGNFIESRPYSANYLFVAKGRMAHAGRDFHQGVNAITPLADLALKLAKLSSKTKKIQVNIASIQGGNALNIVPDLCSLGVNIRMFSNKTVPLVKKTIDRLLKQHPSIKMHILSERNALEPTAKQKEFYKLLSFTGKLLKQTVRFTKSGGVTDGNVIARLSVPVIDSCGIIGKGLHTHDEQADALSLVPRAELATLLILLKAKGSSCLII